MRELGEEAGERAAQHASGDLLGQLLDDVAPAPIEAVDAGVGVAGGGLGLAGGELGSVVPEALGAERGGGRDLDSLTSEQRGAVLGYLGGGETEGDVSPSHREVNGALRGDDPMTPHVEQAVEQLDSALRDSPSPGNMEMSLAVGFEAFDDDVAWLEGTVQCDQGYMSWTLGGEADLDLSGSVILHLEVSASVPMMCLDATVLLGRGQPYEVRQVEQRPDGRWDVWGHVL